MSKAQPEQKAIDFVEVEDIQQLAYEDYRQDSAYNQTYLKQAYWAPHKVPEQQEQNEGQAFGGLVDAMLFGTFQTEYVVMPPELDDVSDTVKSILKYAYYEHGELSNESILEGAEYNKYGQRWNDDTIIKKVRQGGKEDAGEQYFDILREQGENNKQLVSTEDYTRALETEQIVEETYKDILNNTEHQLGLRATIHDVRTKNTYPLKGLLDMIDKENRIIYDLKVISKDLRSFGPSYYLKFGYYIQAALYYLITEMKYTFKFCLVNPNYPQFPYIRTVAPNQLRDAYTGFDFNNYYYPGLIDMLKIAQKQEEWGFEAPAHVMQTPENSVVLPYEHF